MINADLNDYNEAGLCGEIARQLIKTAVTLITLFVFTVAQPESLPNILNWLIGLGQV